MKKLARNYAFIDAQNLNLGIQELGWKLDYRKFRRYLREKYAVEVAYMFLGFVISNQGLYSALQKAGFILNFKPVVLDGQGKFKGNYEQSQKEAGICAQQIEKAPLQNGT